MTQSDISNGWMARLCWLVRYQGEFCETKTHSVSLVRKSWVRDQMLENGAKWKKKQTPVEDEFCNFKAIGTVELN